MFDDNPRDKVATLLEMEQRARNACQSDQAAMKAKMAGWIARDSRYRDLNPHQLVDYYFEKRGCGAQVDLDSPALTGKPRPEYK